MSQKMNNLANMINFHFLRLFEKEKAIKLLFLTCIKATEKHICQSSVLQKE